MAKRSNVWMHFSEAGKCKYCNTIVKHSGNTTNLRNHILRKHPTINKVGNESNSSSRSVTNFFYLDGASDANDDICSIDSGSDLQTPSTSTCSAGSSIKNSQQTLRECVSLVQNFKDGGSRAGQLDNAILYMIVKDDMPLSTVEKCGFKYFAKTVAPLYKVPGRTKMGELVEHKYEVLSLQVKEKLKHVPKLSLTTDVWTDTLNAQSYLGVTCHFIDFSAKKIVSHVLAVRELTERHNSEYIGSELLSICSYWGIDYSKIAFITTDNASNMKKAICDTFGRETHVTCYAHTINLVANKPFEETVGVAGLKTLQTSVKQIVTYFKQSVVAADELRKVTDLKLLQSVCTRWNSFYYQLERFHELSHLIAPILLKHSKAPAMLTAGDMDVIEDLLLIFKPFEQFTVELSGEKYCTGSLVIPLVHLLERSLESASTRTPVGMQTKFLLIRELGARFSKIEEDTNLAICTILDPRFKKIHFKSPVHCATAVQIIKRKLHASECADPVIEDNSSFDVTRSNSLWAYHEELAQQTNATSQSSNDEQGNDLRSYLLTPVAKINTDIVSYWCHKKSDTISNLWEVACEHHIYMATSVPSERVFSLAGNILTEKRNKLKKMEKILFLKSLDFEDWNI